MKCKAIAIRQQRKLEQKKKKEKEKKRNKREKRENSRGTITKQIMKGYILT